MQHALPFTCSVNTQVSKKYVGKDVAKEIHEKATPFITWLKEAEEDSSEEEEEEDVQVRLTLMSHHSNST